VFIEFDYSKGFIKEHEIEIIKPQVDIAHQLLHDRKGPGSEFTGWLEWTETIDREELERIHTTAERIRQNSRYTSCYRNWGRLISEPERQWKLCPTASTIFWIKAPERHRS